MAIINLCPHVITLFTEEQFLGLSQEKPTLWLADGVVGCPLAEFQSQGSARISVTTEAAGTTADNGLPLYLHREVEIPIFQTVYGELILPPEINITDDDILVVSLPTASMARQSGHPLSKQMVTPYQVVRLRTDTNIIIGATGFSYLG